MAGLKRDQRGLKPGILVVNPGSSSLKLCLLGPDDEVLGAEHVERWGGESDVAPLQRFVGSIGGVGSVTAVGHRVVHGGTRFTEPVVLDDARVEEIAALTDLAPLHQPAAVAAIRLQRRLLPGVPAVACFDTAFHAGMPAAASTYALPEDWRTRWPLRRFGFHGLSHAYAVRRAVELAGLTMTDDVRVVSCHLGAGASLCAARGGRSVDTTMGFTPLEGLVMATRSGSVDPGLVLWLVTDGGLDAGAVTAALEHGSGMKGLAGSGDMRDVHVAIAAGDPDARLALDVYVHRLRREIAAMVAALGGMDVLAFTGGVGEHDPVVRRMAVDGLGFLGVSLSAGLNAAATSDARIDPGDGGGGVARVVVLTAREDVEIASQVRALVK